MAVGLAEKIPSIWQNVVIPPGYPGGAGGPGGTPAPSQNAGYEIYVRAAPGYSQLACVLPRFMSLQFSKVLNDKGAGTIVCNLDDPFWQNATISLPGPTFPFVVGSVTSTTAAASYSVPVSVTSPDGNAVTVVAGQAGATNYPDSCNDSQGNAYFCVPVQLLTANPYFQTGNGAGAAASTAGWVPSAGGQIQGVTAQTGSPLPFAVQLTATGTSQCSVQGTAFAITPSSSYLITALVYSAQAGTCVLGINWDNSGTFVSDTLSNISVGAGWTCVGMLATAPASGVNQGVIRCGIGGTVVPGESIQVTAFAAQTPQPVQVFQTLNSSQLTAGQDTVSVGFSGSSSQSTVIGLLSSDNINISGAVDIAELATGSSATAAPGSATPQQIGELGILAVMNAHGGGQGSTPSGWTYLGTVGGTGSLPFLSLYGVLPTNQAPLAPSSAITSAAWNAALVTLMGTVTAPAQDLFNNEHLYQVYFNGFPVFDFFGETETYQLVDQSEQTNITVTGPGTIAALGWGAAMPPGFPDIVFKTDAIQDGFAEINQAGQFQVDTSLWNVIAPAADVQLNPSGTLQITASTGTTFCGATPYDLTNSLFSAQVIPLGQSTANTSTTGGSVPVLDGSQVTQMYFQSNSNANDYILIGVTASGLYCKLGDAVKGTQTKQLGSYNANSQSFLQITHSYSDNGATSTIQWWASPDGENWTLLWQVKNPSWTPNNGTVFFACSYDVNNTVFMQVTNVNGNVITPSSAGNIFFGEPIMAVWYSIFQAAQARNTIPFVTTALSGVQDSFGNQWTDSESVQIQNGTDLYALLQSHTAIVNADYIMQPNFVLQVGLPEEQTQDNGPVTLGFDRSSSVIVREAGSQQSKQWTRDRSQIANLVGAVNSDGTTISASNEESITTWGQRESWLQTAVQVDPTSILIAAQASVLQTKDEVLSYTITINPNWPGAQPWANFNVGDWIGVEVPGTPAPAWQVMWTGNGSTATPSVISPAGIATLPVTAGDAYTFEALLYSPQGWASGVYFTVAWLNSGGGTISTSSQSGSPVSISAGNLNGTQLTFASQTAPGGAVACRISLVMAGTPASTVQMFACAGIQSLPNPTAVPGITWTGASGAAVSPLAPWAPGLSEWVNSTVQVVRVMALAVSVDASQAVTYELTIVTYRQWLVQQLQYLVNKMGGQFINSLGTTPVTSSSSSPTQLPTVFAPSMDNLANGPDTGFSHGAPLVYNSITGQWQGAGTFDPETGATVTTTGPNLQTLHYSTATPQAGQLIASISALGGADDPGNPYLPGIVSYGSDGQIIQLNQGQVTVGNPALGSQIVLNPTVDQVFNVTSAITGVLQACAELTTTDVSETVPGLLGSLIMGTGSASKMATALTSPFATTAGSCLILESENDGSTDAPVMTLGTVQQSGGTLLFSPVMTVGPFYLLMYGGATPVTIQTFTSSTTWPAPAGVTSVKVECWGGSAGGWGGSDPSPGGGAGEYAAEPSNTVIPTDTYTITIGAAGSGGAAGSSPHAGTSGGTTTFSGTGATTVTAHGGQAAASVASTAAGGTGSANTTHFNGGSSPRPLGFGGSGGGSSGGTGSAGNPGIASTGNTGGAAGLAVSGGAAGGKGGNGSAGSSSTAGAAGVAPGGGGGGGGAAAGLGTGSAGGAGAAGQVRLTYIVAGSTPSLEMSCAVAAFTDQFGNAVPAGFTFGNPTTTHVGVTNSGLLYLGTNSVAVRGLSSSLAQFQYQSPSALGGDGNTYDTGRLSVQNTGQTITATSGSPATIMSATLGSGQTYHYRAWLLYAGGTAAGTPSVQLTFSGTGGTTEGGYVSYFPHNASSVTTAGLSVNGGATAGPVYTTLNGVIMIEGWFTNPTGNGTLTLQGFTSNAADSFIIAGGMMEIMPIG